MEYITVGNIECELNRKAIKNLHISVLPPEGKVRIAVPEKMSETMIRVAIVRRLSWIKKQQQYFQKQPRQSEREFITGESHYLWGKRYRLNRLVTKGRSRIEVGHQQLTLYLHPYSRAENIPELFNRFYRTALKERAYPLLQEWCEKLDLPLPHWRVQKMKTHWGSCNPDTQRILLNSELAKKPIECLEYIIVHELIHLIERTHNQHFLALLDRNLSNWRERRVLLNLQPLGFEEWDSE